MIGAVEEGDEIAAGKAEEDKLELNMEVRG